MNTDTTFLYKEVPKHPYYKKYFDVGSSVKMFNQIEDNYIGLIKTWAVKWYASIFLNNGLCLYPQYALAKNIGFDGTGVNCGIDAKSANQHQSLELKTPIKVSPIKIEECHVGYKYLKRYYLYGEDSSLKMKIITNINKFRFLRKIYRFYFKVKRLI